MTIRPDRDHRGQHRHPLIAALKGRRLALGVSQEDLADALGIRQSDVSCWETGRMTPTLGSLTLWADALDCELLVAERAAREAA